jgi:hypothetical protein
LQSHPLKAGPEPQFVTARSIAEAGWQKLSNVWHQARTVGPPLTLGNGKWFGLPPLLG